VSSRRRSEQQEHGRRIEQHRDNEDEITEHVLVAGAEQRRQIAHRANIGLDCATLAVDGGAVNLQGRSGCIEAARRDDAKPRDTIKRGGAMVGFGEC